MLTIHLRLFLMVLVAVYTFFVIRMLYKQKLNYQYSLLWLLTSLVLIVVLLFPEMVVNLTRLAGAEMPSNMVFLLAIVFTIMLLLNLTCITSQINKRIVRISQQCALMERRVRDLEAALAAKDGESHVG